MSVNIDENITHNNDFFYNGPISSDNWSDILKNVPVEDHNNCKLVCKFFKESINKIKPDELDNLENRKFLADRAIGFNLKIESDFVKWTILVRNKKIEHKIPDQKLREIFGSISNHFQESKELYYAPIEKYLSYSELMSVLDFQKMVDSRVHSAFEQMVDHLIFSGGTALALEFRRELLKQPFMANAKEKIGEGIMDEFQQMVLTAKPKREVLEEQSLSYGERYQRLLMNEIVDYLDILKEASREFIKKHIELDQNIEDAIDHIMNRFIRALDNGNLAMIKGAVVHFEKFSPEEQKMLCDKLENDEVRNSLRIVKGLKYIKKASNLRTESSEMLKRVTSENYLKKVVFEEHGIDYAKFQTDTHAEDYSIGASHN